MRKTTFPILEVVATASLLVIAFTVVIKLFPSLEDDAAAGWAQAFGAVIAIAGSYYLGERQANTALKNAILMDELARAKKRSAIIAIADTARKVAEPISERYDLNNRHKFALLVVYNKQIFSGHIDAIAAIPVHEIGSADGVTALLGLKNCMIEMQAAIEKFLGTPVPATAVIYEVYEQPDPRPALEIAGTKARLVRHCDDLIAALTAL